MNIKSFVFPTCILSPHAGTNLDSPIGKRNGICPWPYLIYYGSSASSFVHR